MDGETGQLQFLGFFGINKEAFKMLFSWRKIFAKIALTLIFPLCLIFLSHVFISDFILKRLHSDIQLYSNWSLNLSSFHGLKHKFSSQWAILLSFTFTYFLFAILFSLFSTSAVIYTVASIYTSRDITFKKVISVVPWVWAKIFITFLWNLIIMLVHTSVSSALLWSSALLAGPRFKFPSNLVFFAVLTFSLMGFVYFNVIWSLGSVISVLEDSCGVRALKKGVGLIKGKLIVSSVIFILFQVPIIAAVVGFEVVVVHGKHLKIVNRVFIGIGCFLVLFIFILLGIVVQPVVYFVCKSYHHENISKSGLAGHLDCYTRSGAYVALGGKDVQLEEFGGLLDEEDLEEFGV